MSARRSEARWYREPIAGAIAFSTMSLTAFGIFGLRSRGGDTSSPVISFCSSAGDGVS